MSVVETRSRLTPLAAILLVAYTCMRCCATLRMTRLVALLVCAAPAVFASTVAGSLRGGPPVIVVVAADIVHSTFLGGHFLFAGSFLLFE